MKVFILFIQRVKIMSALYSLQKHISLFKLTGQDVATFLQNQTINVFDSEAPQPHYTAICNAKGRIIFSLLIWQQGKGFYLAVDQSLAEQFKQYIAMRIFRMAVNVSQTEEVIPAISDSEKARVNDIELVANGPYESADKGHFWALFFRSKLPWITQDTSEQFIPQHLSLDQHQLIEYQKGCYPGQEIIARLHFIGRNKKEMDLEQIGRGCPLKNGEKVTIHDNRVQLCSPVIEFNGQFRAQLVKNSVGGIL
jgi:folate-binding protein YgfZ